MPNPNYRQLHETGLKDVIDKIISKELIGDNLRFNSGYKGPKTYSSIAKATAGLTLVFPILCTRSINAETASMISKALESRCVTMMQMLFSATQVSNIQDVQSFVDQFHKNIKLNKRYTVDDFINFMDNTVAENCNIIIDKNALNVVREDMKNINFYFEENLDDSSYKNFSVTKKNVLKEVNFEKYDPDYPGDDKKVWLPKGVTPGSAEAREWAQALAALSKADTEDAKYKAQQELKRLEDEAKRREAERIKCTLLDADIKKANELMPTIVSVAFHTTDSAGNSVTVESAVLGIKAKLIGVESSDITNHLVEYNNNSNILLQLIRATTRETSFVKDFLFAVDKAKIDTLSVSRKGSANPMWKVLEQRANKFRRRKITNGGNDASAITTLILSKQSEVDYLLNQEDINVMNPRIAGSIMDGYNFMSVIVVDELLEVVHVMWDNGDYSWEDLSFNALQKQNNSNSDMKKVINLMTKMR